jgi:hypothetical protein
LGEGRASDEDAKSGRSRRDVVERCIVATARAASTASGVRGYR